MMESLRSVVLNRQNTLFDVRFWAFDVRRSLVSFLIRLGARNQPLGYRLKPTKASKGSVLCPLRAAA
ncbi:hypothetical protein D1AOALGA4SA_8723 [Olavius algarvensis Delta 1 endosymbiont]|nr:hypothetical protein D1AOALGA4SA_8723 [Olavius algarvensis Delta 1 endosymbiont]